ncbi:MAG: response regulator [Phycisphaerae bacterium]|nr:response regulator [Phycisphaerae bacterium]
MMGMDESKNRRILVIDDNRAIHDDFRKILAGGPADATADFDQAQAALFGETPAAEERTGFEMDSAYQGQEGLERVRGAVQEGRPYALAFVDVRMPPGWDGIETITRLWEEDSDLQVVVCTAYSDYAWDEMVAKLGRSDRLLILKKPFDNIEVFQFASALTEKWNLARQAHKRLEDLEQAVQQRTRELEDQTRELEDQKIYLEEALAKLQETHAQLLQAQKLESIGQLAAGIAHEINTPIQYVGDNIRFLANSIEDLLQLIKAYRDLASERESGADQPSVTSRAAALADKPPVAPSAVAPSAHQPSITSQAAALEEKADLPYLEEQLPKAIEQGLDGVARVSKIVLAMKGFAHPGTEEKGPADLNHAIETTITISRNEWKYVAEMETELDAALPLVPCLVGEFNQVILNLIVNAAHAIADVVGDDAAGKGTITISTRRDGDWAEVRVRDTGTGILEEHRPRIFDHFFTTKEVGKGTGQGLAIAYSVVTEKHGGTITFETETGKGTTFIIRLPIEDE